LPTYPFERQRYWIDPDLDTLARTERREVAAMGAATGTAGRDGNVYRLRPGRTENYEQRLDRLAGRSPRRIVHLWSATPLRGASTGPDEGEGEGNDSAATGRLRETAVAETVARFGGLHGVVHGAEPSAVGAAYLTVEESASDAASTPGQALLAVRAEGARNLQAALDGVLDAPLDFALLLSSTANLTGGLGLLYDAAAGFYLDAFAAQQRDSDVSGWTSVAWDFYLDDTSDRVRSRGIPAERGGPPPAESATCSSLPAFSQPGGSSDEVDPLAALQEATLDALFRLLPAAQLVASPGSVVGFNRLAQHTTQDAAEHREGEDTAPSGGLYPRPQLSTRFVEPRTDTERRIAAVWESMLGVSPVGMDDAFLELGGDSLLAARLVARLREEFALELPVRLFFEASTVAELAREVETRLEGRAAEEQEDVNDLLAMLDDLSEEEIEAELARRAGQEVASTVD
jgi:acyl carrier protein